MSYIDDDVANGERRRNGIYFQGEEYDYMHNHTLSPQHLMPLEEEDNDGAILMLRGAQRGELQLYENGAQYCKALGNVYFHSMEGHQRFKWVGGKLYREKSVGV